MDISPVLWVAVVAACFSGLLPKAWEALVRRDKTQVLDHTAIANLRETLAGIQQELALLRQENSKLRQLITTLETEQRHLHGCLHRLEEELKTFRREHGVHHRECSRTLGGLGERIAKLEG